MDAKKMYNTWKKDSKQLTSAKQLTKVTACMIALDIQYSIADNVNFLFKIADSQYKIPSCTIFKYYI